MGVNERRYRETSLVALEQLPKTIVIFLTSLLKPEPWQVDARSENVITTLSVLGATHSDPRAANASWV